jgi:uncharacterized protein YndB with AHSA1/START domain
MTTTDIEKLNGIENETVQKATGRTWAEWLQILDDAGAAKLSHGEIATYLDGRIESGWWAEMVAVAYEQARGPRVKYQKPDGFEISASKTIDAPVDRLYAVWDNAPWRKLWLGEEVTVRKATPSKSMRITWTDGASVNVYFYSKGERKSQVTVQHSKLPDAAAAEDMKAFWKEALNRMEDQFSFDGEC